MADACSEITWFRELLTALGILLSVATPLYADNLRAIQKKNISQIHVFTQDGILFDNILIASDEKVVESVRETSWKPKFEVKKERQKAEEAAADASDGLASIQKKVFDVLCWIADIPFLEAYKIKIIDVIEKREKQPNFTIGILISILVVIVTVLFRILFGGKKPAAAPKVVKETKNSSASETDNQGSSGETEDKNEKEDAAAPLPWRSRRET
ncbi:calnexin homolog [Magnolia sinica]|uniref:calnexin homolog n=1 Tax=Magnolia sinica TaxID=86752 RepID=UPI002658B0D7|nr:calnexin homolog [Magnolia sinica]